MGKYKKIIQYKYNDIEMAKAYKMYFVKTFIIGLKSTNEGADTLFIPHCQ